MRVRLSVFAALLAMTAGAAPARAAYPGVSGAIAWRLFAADPNGSMSDSIQTAGGTLLSCGASGGSLSCDFGRVGYSPDGRRLVVARQDPDPAEFGRGGPGTLMVAGADGSSPRTLPRQTADDEDPAFLPSGAAVVFSGTTPTGQNLYSVGTGGTGLRRLTSGGGSWPAPCPNGTIAFVRKGDLYLLGSDLRSLRRLTFRGGLSPSCSPDSRTVAFVRANALYTIRADGSHLVRIPTPHPVLYPAFAPTGHAIAYESDYDHPSSDGSLSEVDVVNLQGRPAMRDVIGGLSGGSLGEDSVQSVGGPIDWQPLAPGPPPRVNVGLVPGSPFPASRALTCSVSFSPNGKLLATANTRGFGGPSCGPFGSGGGSVSVFSIRSDGTARAVKGSPFSTAGNLDTRSVAFDPNGMLVAVAVNRIVASKHAIRPVGGGVMVFSVAPSGVLRKLGGAPFPIGGGRVAESLAFSPTGRLVAVGNDTGTVSMFSVRPSGALAAVRGSPFRTGSPHPADALAFSPSGELLASLNADATISMLRVSRSGALTPATRSPSPFGGQSLTFEPPGRFLAAGTVGGVSILSVDQATGRLSNVSGWSPLDGTFGAAGVTFGQGGAVLAVPNSGFGGVALFSVGSGGSLTQIPGLPWMPDSMFSTGADTPGPGAAFDPSGHLLALPQSRAGVSILRIR